MKKFEINENDVKAAFDAAKTDEMKNVLKALFCKRTDAPSLDDHTTIHSYEDALEALGEKYGYKITVACPPLSGCVRDLAWDTREDPEVVTYVDIPCQCMQLYKQDVVDIIENKDTTEFESYLFNPHSFCLLGGGEYLKTHILIREMRKFVDGEGYEYRKFGDIPQDHEIGDPLPDERWGTYKDSFHWGYT